MAGAAIRRAPYKDTLQPALHKRFSSTATLLLGVSYVEALVLASWSSFLWPWFPLGPSGIRTALIFSCGLTTLILRIANYHVGLHTESGLQTLKSSLLSLRTYETLFWYGLSSALFGPIYLWAMADGSNLRWIVYFSGDRARLNERPLFLTCYLLTCAFVQTMAHYKFDIDRLVFRPSDDDAAAKASQRRFHAAFQRLPTVFATCIKQAVSSLIVAFILYFFTFRSFAWSWALMWLRPFYNLPKTNIMPPSWPSDVFLLIRCVCAGTMLSFIWAAGNTSFSVFMARAPLKNGKPLTCESKDPNGSLLNGLKSKKLSIQCFAMWELAIIANNVETRRQAIFTDIDRKDGPMWSQVYAICISIIKSVEDRVDAYGKPTSSAEKVPIALQEKQKISGSLKESEIFTKTGSNKTPAEKAWNQIATSPGKSPISELSPIAKKTWKSAKDRVLSKSQQDSVSPTQLKQQLQQVTFGLLQLEFFGGMFRQQFRTEFAAAVLGGPFAEPTLFANACQALCDLAVHSLAEDQFGHVHRDVASIIRTLTSVINKVDKLKAAFPSHWTDTTGLRDCPEVDQVLVAFRKGLEQVVAKFEPYSVDLRLSLGDLRLAKEAMIEIKPIILEVKKDKEVIKTSRIGREGVQQRPKGLVEKEAPRFRQRAEQKRPEMEQVR